MSPTDRKAQARAWARVARAAADAHGSRGGDIAANRELFGAIEHAATEAQLSLRDVVDAYAAGAPELDLVAVHEAVEDYLGRIAFVQEVGISTALSRIARALPDWRRRLALRIAVHDLALSVHRARGDQGERIEHARRAIVEVLEGARAADASEQELDAFVRQLRIEQCDLESVVAAAAWLAAERARLARQRGMTLPGPAWATACEISQDRGVTVDTVEPVVADALLRGLMEPTPRGLVVTPAGLEHALADAAKGEPPATLGGNAEPQPSTDSEGATDREDGKRTGG
jgi:hypothetical protein